MKDLRDWITPEALAREVAIEGHAEGAKPDRRRASRAGQLVAGIAEAPAASFPSVFPRGADLEALYRFVNSDRFGWRDLLEPHVRCTAERAGGSKRVLVAHDTSDLSVAQFDSDTPRTNFAPLSSRKQGMKFHAGLAIRFDEGARPVPLGLVNVQPYVHRRENVPPEFKAFWQEQGGWYPHEMKRWFEGVERSEEALSGLDMPPVHVMDREADSYGLLSYLDRHGHAFVVRLVEQNRRDGETGLKMSEALESIPFVAVRTVKLGARSSLRNPAERTRHPPRKERQAELAIRAKRVVLKRPPKRDSLYTGVSWDEVPKQIEVNVVHALEVNPPSDQAPVQWLLLTSEPIDTTEDILRIVDFYRARWLIEEYFKALKTGCSLEKRQLASAEAMLKTLALLAPVAWRLLLIRYLADDAPDLPGRGLLPDEAFRLLQAYAGKETLPDEATIHVVMYQLAALGGHRKNNGPPGWQTLGRGMEKLIAWMEGAALARGEQV